jgi:hypothetical protein
LREGLKRSCHTHGPSAKETISMHGFLVAIGVVIVLMIIVHIIFKVIKFTLGVFLFGIALIAVVYVFQTFFGIDLLSIIFGNAT